MLAIGAAGSLAVSNSKLTPDWRHQAQLRDLRGKSVFAGQSASGPLRVVGRRFRVALRISACASHAKGPCR